ACRAARPGGRSPRRNPPPAPRPHARAWPGVWARRAGRSSAARCRGARAGASRRRTGYASRSRPDHAYEPRLGDVGITREERQREASRGGADQRVERIVVGPRVAGEVHVFGDEIESPVGGIREEVGEELTQRSPEVDAADAGKETRLPHGGRGNV